jgi:Neutral/alkaline non-lysosomal ceramidase, N-terminal
LRGGGSGEKLARMKLLRSRTALAVLFGYLAGSLFAADPASWKAGTARANITPTQPLWMAGFASRTNPATGKCMDLWIKVLALEDARGHRAIVLSGDLLGFPQSIYRHTCTALKEKYALEPDQILLTVSHTHCGPVLRGALYDVYPLDAAQISLIENYSADLEAKMVETVGQAIADLAPARLAAGQGSAGFAVNRRNNQEPDVPRLIAQGALKGPVDHSVPVLAVYQPDGKLKAVLFGYACHNTVMDFYKWCGDYAGFAQLALEKSHPEATAMFFMGCGADQNALPRRQLELAERYGNMLAAAVEKTLLAPPQPLAPELRTAMETVTLHLGPPPTEAELVKLQTDKTPMTRRWATRLLADLKTGKPFIHDYPLPVQAWQFGGQQLLITLGGEPVVDWALKFKHDFGPQTWVAGYCNDVMNYIPSLRVLKEDMPPLAQSRWGYEGAHATMVYGLPASRWADDVEDLVTAGVRHAVEGVQSAGK